VQIITPINQTYNTTSTSRTAEVLINITNASDAQAVWFFNETGNATYTAPAYMNFTEGSHTIIAYANDSAGNLNQTSITFNVYLIRNISSSWIYGVYYNYSQTIDVNTTNVTNSNITDTNISRTPPIEIINSTLRNSTLINVTSIINCTIIDSTKIGGACINAYIDPSTVVESDTNGATITDSQIYYSNVSGSTAIGSFINLSNMTGSYVYYSNVTGSSLINSNVSANSTINSSSLVNSTAINSTVNSIISTNSTITNSSLFNTTIIDANITNGIMVSGNITLPNGTMVNVSSPMNLTELVNYAPIAGFTYSASGNGNTIIFTSNSTDSNIGTQLNDSIVNYTWIFGDGTSQNTTTNSVSHTYAASSASYMVNLTATDSFGLSNTYSTTLTVTYAASGSGGSSGGGGSCTTSWTCSNWTSCINGSQTRTCTKINQYCTANETKPAENQSCLIFIDVNQTEEESEESNQTVIDEIKSVADSAKEKISTLVGSVGAFIGANKVPVIGAAAFIGGVVVAFFVIKIFFTPSITNLKFGHKIYGKSKILKLKRKK
jgi:hypothetical protein